MLVYRHLLEIRVPSDVTRLLPKDRPFSSFQIISEVQENSPEVADSVLWSCIFCLSHCSVLYLSIGTTQMWGFFQCFPWEGHLTEVVTGKWKTARGRGGCDKWVGLQRRQSEGVEGPPAARVSERRIRSLY